MKRRLRLAGLAVIAALIGTSCGNAQFVFVTVIAGAGLNNNVTFTALVVILENAGVMSTREITGAGGMRVGVPNTFTAETPARLGGTIAVTVNGLEGLDVIASGSGSAELTGDVTDVTVVLTAGGGAVCGNGALEPPEQCDDGNTASGDGCSATCQNEVPPMCGDGVVNAGEECDEGGETASCDVDCTQVACGDGLPNSSAGEECDEGGETASCDADCTQVVCGDGLLNSSAGEECDDGNTMPGDGCDPGCITETVVCSLETDGDLVVNAAMTLPSAVYDFGLLWILPGATLTFSGPAPVEIWANDVIIEGTLDLRGGDALDSDFVMAPNGGNGGPGGGGGGGGGQCGFGVTNPIGVGGTPNGMTPLPYISGGPGEGDGGFGGLAFGVGPAVPAATGGEHGPGGGGGGGGSTFPGTDGELCCPPGCTPGGASYSDSMMSLFTGGGGGGGGGANGGGGGGGGGAVRIIATNLTVAASGLIDANGGDGGVKISGSCTSGGGGGGAGGMVWLEATTLEIDGTVQALGGFGGPEDLVTEQFGGDGSEGRIQISGVTMATTGVVVPAPFVRMDPPACR